jgi:hypothetical protein
VREIAPIRSDPDKFIVRDSATIRRHAAAHGQIPELGLTRTTKRTVFLATAADEAFPRRDQSDAISRRSASTTSTTPRSAAVESGAPCWKLSASTA